ncbi:uncharacterized protein BJ171DRAFT_478763 [Polychytrium aggregatum]|uniref:uncharacterized protein n=1 Tax=Polychytrium aggregatum TaxID=110093 RepID=UPI0022FED59B|nr:uncharacterized protein BJ171DRAFT_478763 [Polychytrium aggregatum]KAI9193628.1 hypothetical protein BJ171DRAFT_478763 [Polychytrium aggregatum]
MFIQKSAFVAALLASASAAATTCSSSGTTLWGPTTNWDGVKFTLPLGEYNLFASRDYVNSKSVVEGRAAAGRFLDVGAGFGSALYTEFGAQPAQCSQIGSILEAHKLYPGLRYTLTVGGEVRGFPSTINNGAMAYVSSELSSNDTVFRPADGPCHAEKVSPDHLPFDFDGASQYLGNLSTSLAALPATGNWAAGASSKECVLTLNGGLDTEVVSVNAKVLANCNTLTFGSTLSGTLILNVNSKDPRVMNIDFQQLSSSANRIIWNFYDASVVHLGLVSFYGTVLAPKAIVDGKSGLIKGNVYAKSVSGPIQILRASYDGCIPGPAPPTSSTVSGTASATATPSGGYTITASTSATVSSVSVSGASSAPTVSATSALPSYSVSTAAPSSTASAQPYKCVPINTQRPYMRKRGQTKNI